MAPSPPRVVVRLPEAVGIARSPDQRLFAVEGARRVALGPTSDGLLTALKLLRHGDVELAEAGERLGPLVGDLPLLLAGGWLTTAVVVDDVPLIEVRIFGPAPDAMPDLDLPVALSRFALLRRDGDGLVLESATVAAEARLTGRVAESLVLGLGRPGSVEALVAGSGARDAVLRMLGSAGFLVNVPGPEDEQFRLRQWSPHEALFHGRSRWGALAGTAPVGPSSWADGSGALPPARRAPDEPARRRIVLDRPGDPGASGFFDVLERRKSLRFHDAEHPLDLERLSEFLFRAARVRSTFAYEGVEYTDRPFPNGGGAHELEIYIAARQVDGLASGFYRYDPFDHALEAVDESAGTAAAFAASAARATTLPVPPQAVIVLAARFGRVLGRYRAMGYATVLKNVGVVYQTMYLVATALGLAPCGLGNGDLDLFAATTGIDRWEEASVGEFALGSRPAD